MTNKEGVVDAGSGNEAQTKILAESDSNASFLRAARAGNLDKIREYLKGSIDINTSNANGLNALHLASKEGHVSVVLELVKNGANVNAATKKGNTALHIASLAGQEEVVKILIRSGANANVQSQNGFTPLYMAAQENHDGVVKFLLANAANQSLATEDGFTPLAVALQQGHDKVVAVLLENDAKGRVRLPALHIAAKKDDCKAAALLLQNDHDPDVTSKSGFTPLHIAAHYGNENIAALLLDKNADVNYSAKHQITPLHVAAKWGKANMVTLLIDKGAKIDASTRDGLTPLHCAARSGHDQVVDLLLEKGAPITAKTKNGLAPLHMASQGDHVDGARILLFHKAPVDDVTVDYLTALHVAAHCGHVRVAKLLLDRKADPNSRALNGFTPLHIACKKNRIKVVELLLKHGASIEATTESGLTPLHVASFMGCMNIVIYLIQHGANPDVPTVRGETPLHLAARANQSDIIRILLRNGAHVDASAREQQTPLHIAARLGNVDIVGLLLQHGAAVDATTKDMYTALHIAAKEGQEEVAAVLLDHGASLTATTKKGFTPLHLAAKYGNIKVARLLLQKDAPVDAQGKNGVTPLHVAAHYDHVNVALLLLDKGAFPHAIAKNGYTPLHIAAKKNQMDIATTLLEYGAKPSAESKAGFTPLHLAAQEGHTDMTTLLIEHHADVNSPAKNGLTPLHLCSQEDKVNVAAILVKNGAKVDPPTKAGYTPLHVACHFGQINMIRFLLQHKADVNAVTSHGYTPLHQAAQQGHTLIINLLLEHKASPNTTTNQGQTALSIAQRLGYISVVETLKIVTETIVTTTTTTVTEEKYKVVAPETMQETFMSDSEDEGAEDTMMGDQSLHYMTTDELKALADDNTLGIDVTRDERGTDSMMLTAPLTAEEDHLTPQHVAHQETTFSSSIATDNVDLARAPVHAGFLVSFMVDARGGAMRGCRHSGVRVIIPPRKAPMPMRITCRYLRKEKLAYPPPLMEGEACASRILEVGPSGAKFLGPVIIEVPHFASLRGREREITILRSDNGESWREHTLEASDDAVHDVFNESFEGEELSAIEDLSTSRITRILTTDFPQYFAIVTRVRQEVHAIGPEGGMVSSTVVPQVQAIFPEGALTKKIKVGLQAQPITPELVTKLLGNRVAVSPIVTVEPRRRKFHKPITLTIPVPQAATKGMINQYSGDAPTLRLLCSITGGTTKAQWEDVTGSTPLTFVNDCVSFTTTVSARFWLMDCRQVNEATKFATELYREAIHVPFMAKFVVFAKRHDPLEAQLRVFCMTDDKEDKTLESQEHFTEVAKSRDVEVLEGKPQYLEFAGNLVPVTKSGEQLSLTFQAFRENRLPFTIRVKDPHQEPMGRVAFMREPRVGRGEAPQSPICNLNIVLPETDLTPVSELVTLEKKYGFVKETSLAKPELIHRADLRLSDIAKELKDDWVLLALQLDLPESDINSIRSDNPGDTTQQALVMLRHWLQRAGKKPTGNSLEKGLRKINREDIVNQCMFNVELVTDDVEKAVAKVHLDQSGFDTFKEELGSSRDASLRRETSLNGTYDEQDIMKDAESAAETSSESSDKEAHFRHSGGRVTLETVTRTSAKTFEETPETLVQTVPTALAESFTQQATNGQLSDTSMHEDDKSEPTIATLSSEATAEMEVSSLEDKSQGENRVEKRDHDRNGFMKYDHGRFSASSKSGVRDSPRNVKLYKQFKNSSLADSENRRVTFDVRYRTMTPPATMRKRKVIQRRNSWPQCSPLKLNQRKKYQQRLKIRDVHEPFWINTYEWLIMKLSPEDVRPAPIARLVEFSQLDVSIQCIKPKSNIVEPVLSVKQSCKLHIPNSKSSDVIKFYFMEISNKYPKHESDKKYFQNLRKRCLLQELKSYSVRSIKPTNFNEAEFSLDTAANVVANCPRSENFNSFSTMSDAVVSDIEAYNFVSDYERIPQQDIYRPLQTISARSVRPLRSSNSVQAEVITCNPIIDLDNRINLKQKITVKDNFQNKENILKINKDVLTSTFSENIERVRDGGNKDTIVPFMQKNQNQAFSENYIEKKVKYLDKYPINIHHNHASKMFPNNVSNKSNFQDITKHCPQDMPDNNTQESKKGTNLKQSTQTSKYVEEKNGKSSSGQSSESSSDSRGQSCSVETSGSLHGDEQSNKPYLRQLFEKDIQSNFSKSSKVVKDTKKEIDEGKDKEAYKKADISKKSKTESTVNLPDNVGQRFLENLSSEICAAQSLPETSPESIPGQSFLKSLEERVQFEDIGEEKPFPASVIGQSFIRALQEQSKLSERSDEKKPIPAAVLGQKFLKSLVTDPLSHSDVKEQNLLGQTFLKNLAEQTSTESAEDKYIPSAVIGQSFLKALVDQSARESVKNLPIPSSVVGQQFLKTLVELTPTESVKKHPDPALALSTPCPESFIQKSSEEVLKETPIPASVIGQAFLKNLVANQESSLTDVPKTDSTTGNQLSQSLLQELSTPTSGQEFQSSTENQSLSNISKTIPAALVEQTFLKTLSELTESHTNPDGTPKIIPSSVIGQSFLKSLLDEQQQSEITEQSQTIPSTVIGQTFLKTLVQNQSVEKADSSCSKVIPAPVLGQSFLKTLVQEQAMEGISKTSHAIPAPVVGQAFLKTLLECQSDRSAVEKSIPSSVIGQSFLKSLVDEQTKLESQSIRKEIDPIQETSGAKTIPAAVLGQSFLKSLVETETKEPIEEKPALIPAPVIGQTFLKSLIAEQAITEKSNEERTQMQMEGEYIESKEQSIPSSVVGQAFLKTLVERSDEGEGSKLQTIPSTVVGQAFLKTLLNENQEACSAVASTTSLKDTGDFQKSKYTAQETPIPSSVIGLAFLKTLTEQSTENISNIKTAAEDSSGTLIPAGVVGQAFLKTLASVSSEPTSESISASQSKTSAQPKPPEENGCFNGSSKSQSASVVEALQEFDPLNECRSDLSEEQYSIIPPPPEFGPLTEDTASSQAPVDPSIIGELLSYTMLVHSMIESMEEEKKKESVSPMDIASGSGSSTKQAESKKMCKKS